MGEIREKKVSSVQREINNKKTDCLMLWKKSVPIFLLGELWNITILDKNISNSGWKRTNCCDHIRLSTSKQMWKILSDRTKEDWF